MERLALILSFCLLSCAPGRKAEAVRSGELRARIESAQERPAQSIGLDTDCIRRDTLTVRDENGNEVFLMRASRDENGEMVAREELEASMVVAAFKNIAERHGRVDLRFDIIVPAEMTDTRWQIRLEPVLYIMEDSLSLEPVLVTGEDFRRSQLRGYEKYGRYLGGIDTNPGSYLKRREYEIFVARNASEMSSESGVTRDEAVEHYTRIGALHREERRDSRKEQMFRRYVKSPIISEGLRLDTVMVADGGGLRYSYVQAIDAGPGLRKAEIALRGGVFSYDGPVCKLSESGRITYYISSLSTLADETPRYLGDAPDTIYMKGLQALKDRDYTTALEFLNPYADFNAALAYCALDYDATAMTLLSGLPPSAKGEYVKALLYSRMGEEEQAVLSFLNACKMDPAFVHRGNLDPEISALVRKYKL